MPPPLTIEIDAAGFNAAVAEYKAKVQEQVGTYIEQLAWTMRDSILHSIAAASDGRSVTVTMKSEPDDRPTTEA